MSQAPIDASFKGGGGGVLPPARTQAMPSTMALARVGSRSKQTLAEGHDAPQARPAPRITNGTMTLAQLAESRGIKAPTTQMEEGDEGWTPAVSSKGPIALTNAPKPAMGGSTMAAMVLASRKP